LTELASLIDQRAMGVEPPEPEPYPDFVEEAAL
jgi:hypothetical protein